MEARQFIVGREEAGERLDRWLTRKMPDFSRGQIKHLLDGGRILINRRRVLIAGWELEGEDSVEVRIPPRGIPEGLSGRGERPERRFERREPRKTEAEARPREEQPGRRRFLEVLHEDQDIIVVEKPAGVLTEPQEGGGGEHLLGMIRGYLKRKYRSSRGSFVRLLHRLDKETSGVVVAAKSRVGEQLTALFRRHAIHRQYLALVEGKVEKSEGMLTFPLAKGEFGGGKKVRVDPKEGVPARTHYVVVERYAATTLLKVTVETGRTHQIRVHLAHIGHPVLGDKIYGRSAGSFPRHCLHASVLGFEHPRTKKKMRFESKLPEDMRQRVDQYRMEV